VYPQGACAPGEDFREALVANDTRVLMGHFPLSRYSECFAPENCLAIIRDPLTRTASEYLHLTRMEKISQSFAEFIQRPDIINRQSKFLEGHSDRTFIGVTEHYGASIAEIYRRFGLPLKARKRNVARNGGAQQFVECLAPALVHRFNELNALDIALYREHAERFK
jgi:hypothetical protein